MARNRILLASCLMTALAACQIKPAANARFGTVERVMSGQMLEVRLNGESQSVQLRLWGLDAPNRQQQPWSDAARDYLQDHVLGKLVQVEALQSQPDRYGRLPAYLWWNGYLINETLIAQGYVLANLPRPEKQPAERNSQYDQRLVWAQQRARSLELGIWNPQLPLRQTPMEFRQQFAKRSS